MILTLTGASGAGKTTIAKELLKNIPFSTQMISSYTTRSPRDTDIPREYKYLSKFRFRFTERSGAFLWTVHVHGNSYGTTKRSVYKALTDDNTVYVMILVPDIIKTLKKFAEEKGFLDRICSFYVYSPPQDILKERLEKRGDRAEEIEKRLADCLEWDKNSFKSGVLDEFVRNDGEVGEAVAEIKNRFLIWVESLEGWF